MAFEKKVVTLLKGEETKKNQFVEQALKASSETVSGNGPFKANPRNAEELMTVAMDQELLNRLQVIKGTE